MRLLADQNLVWWALRADSRSLIDGLANQGELRLGLTDNTRNDLARMNSNLDGELLRVSESLCVHITLHAAGKVGHSDRVMAAEESIVDVLLDHFQPATSHVRLSHRFNLLQAVLLTERIKRVVDPIEQID